MTEHRYNPNKRRYKARTRPVTKSIVKKERESTREERRKATWAHAEKYCRRSD